MSLSATIAPHLPFLRRFSRAVSGSQESGDALVAAMLEAIIADVDIFPDASNDRIALYKVFARLFTSVAIRVPQEHPQSAWEQRAAANLNAISPRPRQAFLLVAVEGFSEDEAAEILDVDDQEFSELLAEASSEISRQVATDVLIIEDEPLIAMDIEQMVESLGHRVVGTARTHAEAVAMFTKTRPKMVLADIQLADGSSGIEAVNEILYVHAGAGDLHHRLSRAPPDRRAAGAGLPRHQAVQSGYGQGPDQPGAVLRPARESRCIGPGRPGLALPRFHGVARFATDRMTPALAAGKRHSNFPCA